MRPSAFINRILLYCLCRAAEQFEIRLHAFCFMSNHFHLILTDPEVELPDFMHRLNLYIAKSMNAHLRRRENFWSPRYYSYTALEDDEAVLSEIIYVLMNPAAAGLVRSGDQWPGLRSRPDDVKGRHIVATRAGPFFSKLSAAPDVAEFDMVRPPIYEERSDEELAKLIRRKVEEHEAEARAEMAREGREFLGKKRILALSPLTQPESFEPLGKLNPRVAAKHRWRRIAAIERLTEFLRNYREALARYLVALENGLERARDVVFPAGTYLMRVRYAVKCHAPP